MSDQQYAEILRLRARIAELVATLEAIDEHLIGFSSFDSTADLHHAVRAALAKAKAQS